MTLKNRLSERFSNKACSLVATYWRNIVTCRRTTKRISEWIVLMNWFKRFESSIWIIIPINKVQLDVLMLPLYPLRELIIRPEEAGGESRSRSCARRWLTLRFALLWSRAWQRALPSMRRGVRLRHSQDDRLWGAAFRRGEGKNKHKVNFHKPLKYMRSYVRILKSSACRRMNRCFPEGARCSIAG